MGLGTFAARDVLMSAGVGDGGQLSAAEMGGLAWLADQMHAAVGRSGPPSPFDLARASGVTLRTGGFGELILTEEFALIPPAQDARELGLWAAVGLAGVTLLRRGDYAELRAWSLATHLLLPPWCVERGPEHHPHAPEWLVRLRCQMARHPARAA